MNDQQNKAAPAAPASEHTEIPGLVTMTDDDGIVTLRFDSEYSSQRFMRSYGPSVEIDEAPAAPATGESGAEPVAWINKETLRELVENPRKRLTQVWLNPEKTAEDDTPLVSLESLMNNPFAAAAAWRNKSCKWCGGAGWYTSHTTGYPHEMPCRYCNPNGESKATHRATRPASKSAPEGESNA